MAELKILGAQRVKALQERLEEKKKAEIAEVQATLPTEDDIKKMVDDEFGVTELRQQLAKAKEEVSRIEYAINEKTSEYEDYYSKRQKSAWYLRRQELKQQKVDSVIEAIGAKYKQKSTDLWLCETLEQAKAIVDGA